MSPRRAIPIVLLLAAAMWSPRAHAQLVTRRFDPEDLQLEKPGDVHADLQLGVIRGPSAGRFVLPDFGLDVGVATNLELGADGAFAREGTPSRPFHPDHSVLDNIWLSSKVGVFALEGAAGRGSWAGGFQLGPKIPAATDARGAGFQGLLLLGRSVRGVQVVLNAGAFVDPGPSAARQRPAGVDAGVDLDIDLDDRNEWSLLGDLSAVVFTSGQPNQLQTTFGPEWNLHDVLALSVQGLLGLLPENDRYGALFVVSPRVALFR